MKLVDGWLEREDPSEPDVVRLETDKCYSLDVDQPDGCVWHETGWFPSIEAYCRKQMPGPDQSKREASANAVIARTGTIYQQVSFLKGSWHVNHVVNKHKVGIELESCGRLKKVGGVWRYLVVDGGNSSWLGHVPDEEVRHAEKDGGWFHDFNPLMVRSATLLLGALVDAFNWDREASSWGHADFADHATREDPGPLWGCHFFQHGIYLPEVIAGVFGDGTVDIETPEEITK